MVMGDQLLMTQVLKVDSGLLQAVDTDWSQQEFPGKAFTGAYA